MTNEVPDGAAYVSFAARAERYARAVVDGHEVACKWIKASCQRHLDDLVRSETDPVWPWVFDAEKIGRFCHFLQCLPHIKGEWARPVVQDGAIVTPRIVLEDWQVFTWGLPFGWVHRETGMRRFLWVYAEVARKNAKSTPAAGVALYCTFAEGEPGAEGFSLATKEAQARIVWDMARAMVRRDSEFRLPKPLGMGLDSTRRSIYQLHSDSKYEPLGRDSDSHDGLNPHVFIADEFHAWKDRGLWDVMTSGIGARKQPLGWIITTAGYSVGGVCYEQREYLKRVLNGTLLRHDGMGYKVTGDTVDDDRTFGVIYTLDDDYADGREADNWADEAHWKKANPALGVSVSLEELRTAARKAVASPESQAEFRTKRCNQWLAASSDWMDMVKWDRAADPALKEEDFRGEPAYHALDAAFKTDLFARMKLFRKGEHYYAFGRYWLPESMLDPEENPRLYAWANEGRIVRVDGQVIDIELVRADLVQSAADHDLREVPYDPAMLTQFSTEMVEEGYPMVEVRPTFGRFSEPMKLLQELVLQGRFHHNGDPVLRWMISNVLCMHKGGLIYPGKLKGKERSHKIDGVIALLLALGRAMVNGEADMGEIKQGFVVL
jgi:phage terminase large subunit-like protein